MVDTKICSGSRNDAAFAQIYVHFLRKRSFEKSDCWYKSHISLVFVDNAETRKCNLQRDNYTNEKSLSEMRNGNSLSPEKRVKRWCLSLEWSKLLAYCKRGGKACKTIYGIVKGKISYITTERFIVHANSTLCKRYVNETIVYDRFLYLVWFSFSTKLHFLHQEFRKIL